MLVIRIFYDERQYFSNVDQVMMIIGKSLEVIYIDIFFLCRAGINCEDTMVLYIFFSRKFIRVSRI